MIDTNMGLFHKNYHEFLYHLGLSANYKDSYMLPMR